MFGAINKREESMNIIEIVACPLGKLKPVSVINLLTGLTLSTKSLIISFKATAEIAANVSV